MMKKYQNMNSYGTTTCGIIIDDENKTFRYYPCQSMDVCYGKQVSKKRIKELIAECIDNGFTELPVEWGGKTFYGTGRTPDEQTKKPALEEKIKGASERTSKGSEQDSKGKADKEH